VIVSFSHCRKIYFRIFAKIVCDKIRKKDFQVFEKRKNVQQYEKIGPFCENKLQDLKFLKIFAKMYITGKKIAEICA